MSHATPVYALPYPDEADSADVPRDIQALAVRLEAVLPNVGLPTGAGIDWFALVAPPGFLLCDGSAISRTTYANLFAVIGVAYGGGDGINTFNLPDCRGRVLVGLGSNGTVSALGRNDGTPLPSRTPLHGHSNTLTLPQHGHAVNDPGHAHAYFGWGPSSVAISGGVDGSMAPLPQPSANYSIQTQTIGTGIGVGGITSAPGINGGIGVGGATVDAPSFVVANKAIRT